MPCSIKDIACRIANCSGIEDCWGGRARQGGNPSFPKATIVNCVGRPEIMIITEQQLVHVSDTAKKDWNPGAGFVAGLKEKKTFFRRMDDAFDNKLFSDFDEAEQAFRSFYWTHFVKCPGNIRRGRGEFNVRNHLNIDACADRFLVDELRAVRPRRIVSFGEHPSTWILRKASVDRVWADVIWEELEQIILGKEKGLTVQVDDIRSQLVVMFHPSGQNVVGRWINSKLKDLLKSHD